MKFNNKTININDLTNKQVYEYSVLQDTHDKLFKVKENLFLNFSSSRLYPKIVFFEVENIINALLEENYQESLKIFE